jgi:hypothetical protein
LVIDDGRQKDFSLKQKSYEEREGFAPFCEVLLCNSLLL